MWNLASRTITNTSFRKFLFFPRKWALNREELPTGHTILLRYPVPQDQSAVENISEEKFTFCYWRWRASRPPLRDHFNFFSPPWPSRPIQQAISCKECLRGPSPCGKSGIIFSRVYFIGGNWPKEFGLSSAQGRAGNSALHLDSGDGSWGNISQNLWERVTLQ